MRITLTSLFQLFLLVTFAQEIRLPVSTADRSALETLRLTEIGKFGLKRKSRPGIPAHLHTGIDIRRPKSNFVNEPIFPISEGVVISKRSDGPFAQLIIEHRSKAGSYWTIYEHIAGIEVTLWEPVNPDTPIARFMNLKELNRYGWQFDHLHLEVMKIRPIQLTDPSNPERKFTTYSLSCFEESELLSRYFNPIDFLKSNL